MGPRCIGEIGGQKMYLSQRWSSKSLGPATVVPIHLVGSMTAKRIKGQTKTQGGFDCVP